MTPKELHDEYLDNMKTEYDINNQDCYNCKYGFTEPCYESENLEYDEKYNFVYCFKIEAYTGNEDIEKCENYEEFPQYRKLINNKMVDN